jgi:hypothetical protein
LQVSNRALSAACAILLLELFGCAEGTFSPLADCVATSPGNSLGSEAGSGGTGGSSGTPAVGGSVADTQTLGGAGMNLGKTQAGGAGSGGWVDLGQPHQLSGLEIMFEFDGRNYGYVVEGSLDDDDYSTLLDRTDNTQQTQLQTEALTGSARYVRIRFVTLPSDTWASFFELKVLGT